ncbi:DUF3613 domain-containing protein [Variovorax boronicumulans]|uniref:DUF3613 domain-containing protein n=1 Tax=Variovorax boronicumulans TaxID=436515 RepID=UPI000784029A|nr:DUF3613 domain-containing protein [Variovorax boronicumulans]
MNFPSADRDASRLIGTMAAAFLFVSTSTFAQGSAVDSKAATTTASSTAKTPEAATVGAQPKQDQPTSQAQTAEPEEFDPSSMQIGDATQGLLAWQRSGEIASPTPRTIAGSVAGRSYERYIKSFEHSIPERLGSTVTNGASGANSKAR